MGLVLPDSRESVVFALASKRYVFSTVDKIYMTDRKRFDKKFKESEFFGSTFLKLLPTESIIYARKIAGILISEEEDYGHSPTIASLISKAYKGVQRFYNSSKEVIDIDDFLVHTQKEFKTSIEEDGSEILMAFMVLIYLNGTGLNRKKLKISEEKEEMLSQESQILMTKIELGKNIIYHAGKTSQEIDKQGRLEKFHKVVWPFNTSKVKALQYLKNFPVLKLSELLLKIVKETGEYPKLKEHVLSEEIKDTVTSLEMVFISNLSESSVLLREIEVSKREVFSWTSVYHQMVSLTSDRECARDEVVRFICSCIFLKALFADYNKSKELVEELSFKVLDLLDEVGRLKQKPEELLKVSTVFEQVDKPADNSKVDELLARLRELEKENKELKENLSQVDKHHQELVALRSFVYSLDSEEEDKSYPSEEFMINFISSRRVVIVGGQPTWLAKVKVLLPKVRFLEASKKPNIPLEAIRKADVVILSTYQLNHANRDRAIAEAEKGSVPIRILGKQVNEELTIGNIYNLIQDI